MNNPKAVMSARAKSHTGVPAKPARTRFIAMSRILAGLALLPLFLHGQINLSSVSATVTQAIISYSSPVGQACSLQVADLNRQISIVSAAGANTITVVTEAPHGLLPNAVVYIQSPVAAWNTWQTIVSVPNPTTFTFNNPVSGSSAGGTVGVLVDDVNPVLFPGADQDSRTGNPNNLLQRVFVVGQRYAQFASDGNRYSRALQANSLHHFTLTCGSQSLDQQFQTKNIPLGDTHNEGPLVDRNNPGQYAYPTIQWTNQNQTLIDPMSGLRSFRGTAPLGTPSPTQTFVTAIDPQSVWQNPNAPLTNGGGAATFTALCPSGTCPLFLRADNLVISGGASYQNVGSSLDWVSVTINQASISNPACTGDDCMVVACLTVNGITCASANLQASLTATPATYTFGSKNLMDLWQSSGSPGFSRVEASQATGTVNYTAATQQVTLAGGSPFSIRWTSGSTIKIAGAQYTIASVQNERQLTLVSGPNANLNGAAYTASNFGVLLWKKTAASGKISIGYTTYLYGSTPNTDWGAAADNPCSPLVSVGSEQGYNCFIDQELYWMAADGSDVRDLGLVETSYEPDGRFAAGGLCGSSNSTYQFDPQDGNTWYCIWNLYFDAARVSLIKAHYNGSHARNTPGKLIPDCALNSGVQPCMQFTLMQPNKSQSISQVAPGFNPDWAASGFQPYYWSMTGVSPDGDIGFSIAGPSQDTPGWMFVFTLGDRTPAGTDVNSVRIVAGTSTYRKPPLSWCTIHDVIAPSAGWTEIFSNDLSYQPVSGTYTMTLTSAPLNQTVGAPGGLNTCPANPFGVTGQVCTAITVSGEPARPSDGSFFQNVQIGDLMYLDSEEVRVVALNSATQMTIQRGYVYQIASHTNKTFIMGCGTRNAQGTAVGLWNYRRDPYGTNTSGTTVTNDPVTVGGHSYLGGGIPSPAATVISGGATYNLGATLCPQSQGGSCDQVRLGYMSTALQSTVTAVALDPPFAGHFGIGSPNQVDTHPGPCFSGWCMDARPMEGGVTMAVGQTNQPFTQATGQLWKISGAQLILNRKFLSTMAYVGRNALVDVSGPFSLLSGGPQDSYKYCYAFIAGECQPGSAAGDVYVNAPYVSYPYCYYPGIAQQDDDTNAICIGDLGAYTGNIAQLGYTQHDVIGAGIRRLGPNYSRWNQQDTYWNSDVTPSGLLMASRVRWLDGIRNEDLMTVLPPYPVPDGVARDSFLAVPVTINPPAGLGVQSAIVEFGYAENGGPCTSRQEACVAATSTINPAQPFYFENTENYSGLPCAKNCVITIPALSQRVLYYDIKYLDALGNTLGISPIQVTVTQ